MNLNYENFVESKFKKDNLKDSLIHAALGIAGEAGELVDAIKKHTIYGKPLDVKNVTEELGDLRFYMQALMLKLGLSEEEILTHNVNKLNKRYLNQYTDHEAVDRRDKKEGETDQHGCLFVYQGVGKFRCHICGKYAK